MFRTELSIEEESLLSQILERKKMERIEVLYKINALVENTADEEKEGKEIAKNLFNKIKNASDYEYTEYRDLLIQVPLIL